MSVPRRTQEGCDQPHGSVMEALGLAGEQVRRRSETGTVEQASLPPVGERELAQLHPSAL